MGVTVSGGTISKLTGGKFSNGALGAAFARAIGEVKSFNSTQNSKLDANGDPKPDMSHGNNAKDTGFGLKVVDGKLTGNIGVSCTSAIADMCSRIINQMKSVVEANDFLDLEISLVVGNDADIRVQFFSEAPNADGVSTGGYWSNSTKTLSLNTYIGVGNKSIRHEFGHAIGLPHMGNGTKNFMSYYGNGKSRINVQPILDDWQVKTLTDTYSSFWSKW